MINAIHQAKFGVAQPKLKPVVQLSVVQLKADRIAQPGVVLLPAREVVQPSAKSVTKPQKKGCGVVESLSAAGEEVSALWRKAMNREELYADLIGALLDSGAKKATKLEGPKRTVVATRRFYGNKPDKRVIEVLITDGPPNFTNRQRQKRIKKTGALSPKFILEFPPEKKKR